MMKKLFPIILTSALIGTGCTQAHTAFSVGSIKDGIYINKTFNLKFEGTSHNFTYSTADQSNHDLSTKEAVALLKEGKTYTDMTCADAKTYNTINVTLQNATIIYPDANKNIDKIMDAACEKAKETFQQSTGKEVDVDKTIVKINGDKVPAFTLSATAGEQTFYSTYAFLVSGDYVATISTANLGENHAQEIYDLFTPANEKGKNNEKK